MKKATITEVKKITNIHNNKYNELQKIHPELMLLALDGLTLRNLFKPEVLEALTKKTKEV